MLHALEVDGKDQLLSHLFALTLSFNIQLAVLQYYSFQTMSEDAKPFLGLSLLLSVVILWVSISFISSVRLVHVSFDGILMNAGHTRRRCEFKTILPDIHHVSLPDHPLWRCPVMESMRTHSLKSLYQTLGRTICFAHRSHHDWGFTRLSRIERARQDCTCKAQL